VIAARSAGTRAIVVWTRRRAEQIGALVSHIEGCDNLAEMSQLLTVSQSARA
jgi:hypothetical protein